MFKTHCKNRNGSKRISEARPRRNVAWVRSLAVLATLLAAQVARAGHIVEFQLRSSKLIELVEHRLLEEEICATSSFELPFQNGDFILDHVEFPGPVTMQRTGQQVQFVVPVQIYTKALACLYDPNCGPTDYSPSAPLTANLVLDLTAQLDDDGKLDMCVEFNSLLIGGNVVNIATLDENLANSLGGLLSPKCSKVNVMKSLKKLLNGERDIKQVGVSANGDLSRIGVRLELDDPANPNAAPAASWGDFLNGDIAPFDANMEWSIFMNQSLLKQALSAKFKESLNGEADIEVLSGPSASYMALAGGGAKVTLTMELEVDAGCPFNNVGVDPAIVTLFLFANGNEPNAIQSNGQISTDLVDSDVLACALSFGPFGLIGLPVIAAVAADQGPGDDDFPDECHQVNDDEFQCVQPVTLPTIRLSKFNAFWSTRATLTLDQLFGHGSGISMGGPVTVAIGMPHPPKELLSVGNGHFSFGVQGGCSSLHLGWAGYIGIEGDGRLCQAYVIDDPYQVYGVSKNWEPHALGSNWIGDNRSFDLEFPRIGGNYDAFVNNPYPCHLVIRSSAGSRCVEIPAPDVANVNYGVAAGQLAQAKADCLKPFWFSLRIMELLWLVDPPPFDIDVHTRFTDPFVYTQGVTAQVTEMHVEIGAPISTQALGGQLNFTNVPMNVMANIMVNTAAAHASGAQGVQVGTVGTFGGGFTAGPFGGGEIPAPRAAKTSASARDADAEHMIPVSVEQKVMVDLSAVLGDGTSADVTAKQGISQLIVVPEDQLPEGIAELSFMLEIPVDRLEMRAEATPVEIGDGDQPQPDAIADACGQGTCGVGGAGAVPFMLFGWMSMKRRRRVRRATR